MEVAPGTSFLNRWLLAVYSSKLTPAERDTLAAYAAFMNARGHIRIRQKTIAKMTNRPDRKVRQHIAAARSEGLVELIVVPLSGRVAVYQATIPPGPPEP